MCPFFTPPTNATEVPPIDADAEDRRDPSWRLGRHLNGRPAGRNVFILSNNTVTENDPWWINAGDATVVRTFHGGRVGPKTVFIDLPGISGNFISTPDSASSSITGDIDIRVLVSDVVLATSKVFVGKWGSGQRAYLFRLSSVDSDRLNFLWRDSGGTTRSVASNADHPALVDKVGLRVILDVDNGAGGHAVRFYTSSDGGASWTQLGSDVNAGAFTTSIIDSSAEVRIGSEEENSGRELTGNVFFAEVRAGIDGPVAAKFQPRGVEADQGDTSPTTVTSDTGETWTINGSGWVWGEDGSFTGAYVVSDAEADLLVAAGYTVDGT